MKQFKTTAILTLTGGNLELDADQYRRRRHLVTDNGDGTFAIQKSVQFKAGEEFGYDGEIALNIAEDITPLTPQEAKAKKKRLAREKKMAEALAGENEDLRGRCAELEGQNEDLRDQVAALEKQVSELTAATDSGDSVAADAPAEDAAAAVGDPAADSGGSDPAG